MIDYSVCPSPCYVVDAELVRRNLQLIDSVRREAGCEIILAFKAFAMWRVFPIIREYGFKSTASSANEARLAKEKLGSLAHSYCPAYTDEEFATIAQCSSHITFNSWNQYEQFHDKATEISYGVRVNPEYSVVETEIYNPCSRGSRLGILAKDMPEKLPNDIEGLHFHALCEGSAEDLQGVLENFERLFGKYIEQVKWVNLGGGHLMTRNGYDVDLLIKIIKEFKSRWNVEVILEPGSAFMWETGVLVATVVDIVENGGIKTAILNVSFACHMPDCLEMPYQPRIIGAKIGSEGKYVYRMGGNSCLSGDFVGDWSFDHPLQVGERIVFEDMIHYTTVKTTMFNGVHHPSMAIWDDGKLDVVRVFGYEDYLNRMS